MSTTTKLWLGFGVVIAVLVLIVVPQIYWLRALDAEVRQLTLSAGPLNDAVSGMAFRANGVGAAVSNYLHTQEVRSRQRFDDETVQFYQHLKTYRSLAVTPRRRNAGEQIATQFGEFHDLGQRLLERRDQGEPWLDDFKLLVDQRITLADLIQDELENINAQELAPQRIQTRGIAQSLLAFTVALFVVGLVTAAATSGVVSRGIIQTEETLRVTLSSIGDAVITTDTQGRITYLNPVAEALTGWTNTESHERPLEDVFRIVNEESLKPVESPVAKVLREGIVVGLANHTALITKGGMHRPIDDSAAPIRGERGRLRGVVLIFRDVANRREAERALQASEARKAAVVNAALDGVITIDHAGNIVEFNRAAEQIFETTKETVLGREAAEILIPPAYRERHRKALVRCVATGDGPILNQRLEFSALRNSGEEFPIEIAIAQISHHPPLFTGFLRDISDRKQTEAALAERMQLLALRAEVGAALTQGETLRDMLQSCSEAIVHRLDAAFARVWTLHAEENVLELQASAGLYTHIDGGHARVPVGKFKIGRIAQERQPHVTNQVIGDPQVPEQEWAQREGLVAFAGFPLVLDHELVGVMAMFSRRPLSSTTLDAMASIAQEVAAGIRLHLTQQELLSTNERLEQRVQERTAKLTKTNEALQRSNRELEQFASVASHDLQEPLRKIQAFGDRLQAKYVAALDETGRDYVLRMQTAASRMRRLIDDLLSFSRVTTKAQPFEPVDLNEVAHDVVSDLEGRLQQAGGQVEIGELPTLDADRLQMRQLLQNLIANGLKFQKPGTPPVVRVSARILEPAELEMRQANSSENEETLREPAPSVEVAVQDNGIGFDEKYLDRIFEVFQRLHGRLEYEGTGMGLAICRKIVQRHNGSITARSSPGEGATFLITLPLQQPTPHESDESHDDTN